MRRGAGIGAIKNKNKAQVGHFVNLLVPHAWTGEQVNW